MTKETNNIFLIKVPKKDYCTCDHRDGQYWPNWSTKVRLVPMINGTDNIDLIVLPKTDFCTYNHIERHYNPKWSTKDLYSTCDRQCRRSREPTRRPRCKRRQSTSRTAPSGSHTGCSEGWWGTRAACTGPRCEWCWGWEWSCGIDAWSPPEALERTCRRGLWGSLSRTEI